MSRTTAERNFNLVMAELPQHYGAALAKIGITFEWHNRKKESGASNYSNRTIELNRTEFSRFKYNFRHPCHNQRWCVATLKEEIIHYIATHIGFDESGAWKTAVKSDFKNKSKLRHRLFCRQRDHDSADDEIKVDPDEYKKGERAEEWLVDIILVRDYLLSCRMSKNAVDKKMNQAFPMTYPMAVMFETMIIIFNDEC